MALERVIGFRIACDHCSAQGKVCEQDTNARLWAIVHGWSVNQTAAALCPNCWAADCRQTHLAEMGGEG